MVVRYLDNTYIFHVFNCFSNYTGDLHIISLREEKNGGEQKSPITVLQENKSQKIYPCRPLYGTSTIAIANSSCSRGTPGKHQRAPLLATDWRTISTLGTVPLKAQSIFDFSNHYTFAIALPSPEQQLEDEVMKNMCIGACWEIVLFLSCQVLSWFKKPGIFF